LVRWSRFLSRSLRGLRQARNERVEASLGFGDALRQNLIAGLGGGQVAPQVVVGRAQHFSVRDQQAQPLLQRGKLGFDDSDFVAAGAVGALIDSL
jgi:hypothetical protein